MLAAALLLGLIAGSYPIANTSIGWHLASGHWVMDHGRVPETDPFSTTSVDVPWIDHEWLFQVVVAITETVAGPSGLVILRAILVAALATLLLFFGMRSGLSPPAALVLATLCLYGARIRFFLRPELFTLLIAPTVVWIFLHRRQWGSRRWLMWIAILMAAGANFHGGVLVVPPLLTGLLAVSWMQWLVTRKGPSPLASGMMGVAVATASPMLNPYGWKLYTVPLEIAHLVGLPHIPNPEWISPSFADYPPLYVAMAVGLVALVLRERKAARWILLIMASALALRYVRNVGLFFMLFPVAVGAALAAVPILSVTNPSARRPVWRVAAMAISALVVTSMMSAPGRLPGLGFSDSFYPNRAWDFLQDEHLIHKPTYNDVRFGGFLIHRHYPDRRTFLDDRNELHEPLLAEIHSILKSSDPGAWKAMLDRHGIEVAVVRYNPPFTVMRPDGSRVGLRGFSALWFPSDSWALVYWDDVSMIFVDRLTAAPGLLDPHEYRIIRPDDTEELRRRLAAEPGILPQFVAELDRKLEEQPDCERALDLTEFLLRP